MMLFLHYFCILAAVSLVGVAVGALVRGTRSQRVIYMVVAAGAFGLAAWQAGQPSPNLLGVASMAFFGVIGVMVSLGSRAGGSQDESS